MSNIGADVSHTGLCVTDLARSMVFYCDGLGFVAGVRYELDDTMLPSLARTLEVSSPVRVTSQFVTLGSTSIELLQYGEPAVVGQPSATRGQLGFTHMSFHVDDVDAAAARLVELGGRIIESTRADLGVQIVFLADPDGTRIELMAPKPKQRE